MERLEKLKRFVLERQNEDVGFCFTKPLESTLPETFYAVSILKSLKCEIPRKNKLIGFLMKNLRKETYVVYYVFETLKVLGLNPPREYYGWIMEKLEGLTKLKGGYAKLESGGTTFTYTFSTPNVLKDVFVLTQSLRAIGFDVPEFVKSFALRFRRSSLENTFYTVGISGECGDVVDFVMKHRCNGGFSKKPNSYPPYLEDTYYALKTLKMCGKVVDGETERFIWSLQNEDGGFRRSIYLGVSTLEFSYYAVECLKCLGTL